MKLRHLIKSANTGLDAIKRAPIVEHNTGIKCLRIGDISQNRKYQNWGFSEVTEENFEKFALKNGDILVARTGATVGVNKYIDKNLNSVFNNGLIRLRVKKEYDSLYVYYLLQSSNFNNYINSIAFGTSAQPNIQINDLLNFEIPNFDLEIQKKIAKILYCLDSKIESNNKINDNLYNIIENIFKTWFVKFDTLTDTKFKETEIGLIPEDWTLSNIYSIANIIYGAPFKSNLFSSDRIGKPIIRIRDLKEQKFKTYTQELHPKGYLLKYGDIVVGMDGEFKPYFWGNEEAWLNQRVCVFNNKREKGKAFLYFTLKPLLEYVEKTEAATTVIHIGKNDFDEFKIILPSDNILDKFDGLTNPMIYKIVNNLKENKRLANLKDLILPKLLNGEIEVEDIKI